MEPLTYSLQTNQGKSDNYYKDIKDFTKEILNEFPRFKTSIIQDIICYTQENDSKIRSKEEYIFEFLMIGTLWKVYGTSAFNLDEKPQILLKKLADLRNENENAKDFIDDIRGILMTQFLLPNRKQMEEDIELNLNNFDKLLKYLHATGDFTQEIIRLNFWSEFFTSKSDLEVSEYLKTAHEFTNYFEIRSHIVLGKYTSNIERFLDEKHDKHLWKEDVIFCCRKEIEYHLNMVGAEIMNGAFKNEFNERPRKALLVPGCMRSHQNTCKAEYTHLGLRCINCSKMCNVNELTVMGDEYGFEVYIVSHESSAFSKSTQKVGKNLEL